MKNSNEINKNKIKELIKDNFINKFTKVLNDGQLIVYIINLLGKNLNIFYDKTISNKSLNLIIKTDIISNIKIFMNNCKKIIKNLISSDIISKAKEFIDKQACLEKKITKILILKIKEQ